MPERSIAACTHRRAVLRAALGAAALPAAARAQAPAWPSRPVTVVIPYPPGGSGDIAGRLIGKHLSDTLGQAVIVDNRPGAGTAVGAGYVARATPDGYTLLMSSGSTFTTNPAIRTSLPYDPVASFDPIAIVGRMPLILLANNAVPVRTVAEFASLVKSAPGRHAYASFGTGTTSHFAAEIVLQAIGATLLHVPYKGSAPAMTDLIGGQVPFSFDVVTAALPQLAAGKVRAIAVTSAKRSPKLPAVPTFAESGYPQIDLDTWIAFVAPHGTPAAVRTALQQALAAVVARPAVRAELQAMGIEPAFGDAKAVAAQIDRELPLMRATARRAGIRAD